MAKHLHRCDKCKRYTLKDNCPACQEKTVLPRPGKFSLIDKYQKYKRSIKKEELKKKGLF